jgi:pyruvyl transferase EpsO
MAWLYRRASLAALRYGNVTLDQGKVLVTDRMHPHVLAALRRQHVVLLPDRFGKNRAVYDACTHKLETVHWADTTSQALAMAKELAAGVSAGARQRRAD